MGRAGQVLPRSASRPLTVALSNCFFYLLDLLKSSQQLQLCTKCRNNHLCFTDDAQKDRVICPRSRSKSAADPELTQALTPSPGC
jgi:hypothetical protein